MKVIGLTGAAGAGKDTVCKIAMEWCAREGYDARRVALADPLKVSAARALGMPVEATAEECVDFCNELKQPGVEITIERAHKDYVDGVSTPLISHELFGKLSGREYLQWYGTEAHRAVFGEHFWTDVSAKTIGDLEDEGVDVVFITDVRFPNEASMVYSNDDWHGEIWEVQREQASPVEAHSSETGIGRPGDILIANSGTMADLTQAVSCVCDDGLEVI